MKLFQEQLAYDGPLVDAVMFKLAFRDEHRVVFRKIRDVKKAAFMEQQVLGMEGGTNPESALETSFSHVSKEDSDDDDTNELDSLAEEIIEAATEEENYNAEADDILEQWKKWTVDWADVAKAQHGAKFDVTTLSKNKTKAGVTTKMWDADALYKKIDILEWFRSQPMFHLRGKFESIGIMSKIYLAQIESGAVQERVFSMAKHIQTVLQTSTDAERHERQLVLRVNMDNIDLLKDERLNA